MSAVRRDLRVHRLQLINTRSVEMKDADPEGAYFNLSSQLWNSEILIKEQDTWHVY